MSTVLDKDIALAEPKNGRRLVKDANPAFADTLVGNMTEEMYEQFQKFPIEDDERA